MPRKHRICLPEVTYHTTSFCINLESHMQPDEKKDLMISVLNLALQKYNFELTWYAIRDNSFDFLIKTLKDGENISRIMQFIKSQYARQFNRIMGRTGPFWNERFHDTIIEFTSNPQLSCFFKIFESWSASTVTDPQQNIYHSSYCYLYEDYQPPVTITLHHYFIGLGNSFKDRVKKLLEYLEIYGMQIFPAFQFE